MKALDWIKNNGSWGHPVWALVLAVWFAVSDIQLTPVSEDGAVAYVGTEAFLMMAIGVGLVLGIAVAGLAKMGPRATITSVVVGPVIGVVAAVVAGSVVDSVYNSYDIPTGRYLVLPVLAAVLAAVGGLMHFMGRANAEMVLLMGISTLTLAPYAQERPLWYVAIAGVAGTLLLLWPKASNFARILGMVLYLLALLMFLQLRPGWFTWIAFPFLLFAPLYMVGLYLRADGRPRRVAWWTGAIISVGSAVLGITTGIAAVVKSLPVLDPLVMLAIGAAFSILFLLLARRDGEEAVGFNMPRLAEA